MPSNQPASPPRPGRRPGPAIWLLGAAITIGLLWWALRDVSIAEVWGHLRTARPVPLLAAVVIATGGFLLRVVRWQEMLAPAGTRPPFTPMWHAVAIGFMANHLLPARAGEVARAFVGARLGGLRFSTTLGSLVLERALDGLAILGLMMVPLLTLPHTEVGGRDVGALLRLLALAFGVVVAVAFVFALAPAATARVAHRVLHALLPATWAARGDDLVDGALQSVIVLRHPGPAARVLGWTLVFWVVNASSFFVAFAAFDLQLPFRAALLVQGFIAIGVAIPSVPGYVGPFEAATRVALELYGIDPTVAFAYAVAYHLTTLVPITLLGLWSLRHAAHLRLRQLQPNDGSQAAVADAGLD